MRAQLLALDSCAGPELSGRVAGLWATLSRAGHHLDSEPAPTLHELRDWYDETARLAGNSTASAARMYPPSSAAAGTGDIGRR